MKMLGKIKVPPVPEPQRQPTEQQLDAAARILGHKHSQTYAQNSRGATVRALQIYLASKGYAVGKFDGAWGKKTQAAFNQYQNDAGQTWGRATPKALAYISNDLGPPLPRARPQQVGEALPIEGNAVPTEPVQSAPLAPPVMGSADGQAMTSPQDMTSQNMAVQGEPPIPDDHFARMAIIKNESLPNDYRIRVLQAEAGAANTPWSQGAGMASGAEAQKQIQAGTTPQTANSPVAAGAYNQPEQPMTPAVSQPMMPGAVAANPLRDALLNPAASPSFQPTGVPGDKMQAMREALLRQMVQQQMAGAR